MSRIRSHRYITKIYNSSDCTKYTSIQSKDLCNITKHNFYHNAISITLQSAKFAPITYTLTSKREYIIISINQITNREVTIYGGIFYILTKHYPIYHYYPKIHKMKIFTYIKIIVKLKTLQIQIEKYTYRHQSKP